MDFGRIYTPHLKCVSPYKYFMIIDLHHALKLLLKIFWRWNLNNRLARKVREINYKSAFGLLGM